VIEASHSACPVLYNYGFHSGEQLMNKLALILLLVTGAFAQNRAAHPWDKTAAGVDPERIRQHVRFLSHDLLEGRGTGQRGGDIAAEYIGTQFALAGLKPAGENGTYMQPVPLIGITTQPDSSFTVTTAKGQQMPLKFKDEWVAYNETLTDRADVDADVVFVGYGIEAPEYKWDDYKGTDVRGKVLLMLVNEPPSNDPKFFTGPALTYYGRWTYKFEEAGRKGAAAVVLIHQTEMASYGWEVVRNSNSGEKAFLKDNAPHAKSAGWIQLDIARKLVADSGQDLDQLMKQAQSRDFRPIDLKAHLNATLMSKVRPMKSNNVVAYLPGSDPKLKDQAVMYSAHYDHLGIRPEMPGDNIFNGADDNATGVGIILEIARAFAESPQKPKRSIYFAAVTAEEQGLRGSEYLGKNPPIPAKNVVLALNYDDLYPIGIPEEVEVVGSERTDFYSIVQKTAKDFTLAIKPDSRPEAGHYYRSDHFSFARVGIPSFSIAQGVKFEGHPAEWGVAQQKEYNDKHYHQPSDEYHPDMLFTGNAKMARFGIALGWQAASLTNAIRWKPGDEFEKARKAPEAKAASGK
jgi:Zn-dependent M28 family amino/carboxypeptidase